MASLAILEARVRVLEARLAEVESAYGESLYSLRREAAHSRLAFNRLFARNGIEPITEEDIDRALDES